MSHWISTHAFDVALYLLIATALLRVLSRVLAPYPRARAAVEVIAALSPEAARAVTEFASLRPRAPAPPCVAPPPPESP